MKHVFLSYAREDVNFATDLSANLKNKAWQDLEKLRAGVDWRAAIDDALRDAAALVVVMSPAAKAAEYVNYEWAFALGAGIKVIPLVHQKTTLHSRLEPLQRIDFSTPGQGTPWADLWKALPSTKSAPEIRAQIHLINGKPAVEDGYYIIDISVQPAPRAAKYVKYELHDETDDHLSWRTEAKSINFESRFWSTGDILISATVGRKSGKPRRYTTTLYEALRRGHGGNPNEDVRKALDECRAHWIGS